MRKLYMVGNTHFDPVWLWKWDEAMASIRSTFRSALDRMKEDESFVYSFCTPPVFEWIKNTDEELFKEIKERIKEGRWELNEGWHVQPDCYGASGESYVRQGLYGQKYLLDNFGKMSDCVFNIDSFGHCPTLPQILKKSHIDYYCFVRPEKHHIPLKHPLFNMKGIDGTKILAYRAEDAYAKEISDCVKNQEEKEQDIMIVYGVTDHGGAPTKKLIAEINSIENAEFSTVSRFFEEHKDCEYTVSEELITKDFGPYSNCPKIKKLNRIAEYAVTNAEKASVFAENYDKQKLSDCWRDILFNQFHDILGGACIKEAYFDAECLYGRAVHTANEITHFNLQKITAKMKTVGKNPDDIWNLVIWNLNGSEFDGYLEAEVQWAHEFEWYDKGIMLEDEEKNRIPCQVITAKSVIPKFRSRFVFKAKIPQTGYKMFKVVKTNEEEKTKEINPFSFETKELKIDFNKENGYIQLIFSKSENKELYKNILVPVCYYDDGDTWCFNISEYSDKKEFFEFTDIKIIESGILRTIIKVSYKFKASKLDMYYTFYENEKYFDLRYTVNWNEKHYVFKLETKAESNAHTVSVPYGYVQRSETRADVPMSGWIKSGNISFICDSIFAYNMIDSALGLTVLRSPIYGDLRLGEIDYDTDYDILSQGINEGNIRITTQDISFNECDGFMNKPIIIDECNHDGDLPAKNSYFTVKSGNAYVGALKKCEYDNSDIVRLFEYEGKEQNIIFTYKNRDFSVELKPFEIKTLKIEGEKTAEVYMTEN